MIPLSQIFQKSAPITLIAFLLIMTIPVPSGGLDAVSNDLIFNGSSSFSGSSYVRSGDGSAADPYIISDYAMGTYGIGISNSNVHVILRNITFGQSTSWAIQLSSSSNIKIYNISVDSRSRVISANQCQKVVIFECNFSNIKSTLNSFDFISVTDLYIQDSIFSEDQVTGAGRIAFNNAGSGHVFDGNDCYGVDYRDEMISTNGRISNNTFIDSTALVKGGDTGATITNNSFTTTSGSALTIESSFRLVISHNFFKGPNGMYFNAIPFQWATDPGYIEYNTFESCGYGLTTAKDWQTRVSRYNIFNNYFGNCSNMAVDLGNGNNNNIWRNIFYHNAGTDNSTAGAQASQTGWGGPTYENKWTIGSVGNFWANHRTPDADNNGITDVNYTIPNNGLDTRPSTNPYFDTIPPVVTITEPSGGTYPRSYIRVQWDASDDLSGLDRLDLSVDNGPVIDVLGKSHHSLYLSKGNHNIKITAYDKAGLFDESEVSVIIPETDDVLTLDHPQDNAYYSTTTHQVAWSVKPYFDPVSLKLTVDGNETELLPIARYLTKEFQEGFHSVKVEIVDDDGLSFQKTSNFVVDLTPPDVLVRSPIPGSVISSSIVTFNYSATDNIGIAKVEVRFDDGPYEDITGREQFSEFLSEGARFFNIRVIDLAGIETNLTVPFTIGGDSGIDILEPADGSVTKNTTLKFRWDYEGSFPWQNAQLRVGKSIFEDIGGAKSKDITILNDGEHVITVRLEDIYGNYLEESTTVIKDTKAPIVDFEYPRDGNVLNQRDLQVSWIGTDNLPIPISGYQLKADGGPWEDVGNATSWSISLEPGDHTLMLRAIDEAGNIGEREISFYIDITPPDVVLLSPTDGEYLKDSSTEFRWEASDDYELSDLTLIIDYRTRIEILGRSTYTTTIGVDGEHKISLIAVDSANNIVNITVTVFVDLIPPNLKWIWEPVGYQGWDWVNISWSATDEVGIENLSLKVNDDQIYLAPGTDHINMTLNEGSYRFTLMAVDRVGWDWEIFTTEDLIIDMTSPSLELDLERSIANGRKATLYWTSSDSGSGIDSTFIDIDGEGFNPVISGNIYTFEDLLPGEHRVTLRISDRSGNSQEAYWDFEIEKSGSEGDDNVGGGIPTFGWIAIILVGLLILFMIVGIIISKKRSKVEEKKTISKPQKIDIALPTAGTTAALTQRAPSMDLPPVSSTHKVETTEEGSGYIRPKTEKKKEKQILDMKEEPEGKEISDIPDDKTVDQPVPEPDVVPFSPEKGEDVLVDLPEEEPPAVQDMDDEDTFDPLKLKDKPIGEPVWDEDMDHVSDISEWDEEDFEEIEEIEDVEEWEE